MISSGLKKNQNGKCFNCSKQGHLNRDYKHDVPRNNDFSKYNSNRTASLLDFAEGAARHSIGLMNADQQGTVKAPFVSEKCLVESLTGPHAKFVIMEETPY